MTKIENRYDLSPMQRNLLKESNGRCYYCGIALTGHVCIEHVIPRSRGGSDRIANKVASCTRCNNKKASHFIEELRERILKAYPVFNVVFYFESVGLKLKGEFKDQKNG